MKVFLSWSGESSKHIAHTFEEWLPRFFQAVEPWISTHMPKGAVWDNEITKKLNETKAGILCLTPDNLDSTYLHYEAGAISNVAEAAVYTFLFKVDAIDVKPPLSRFQNTKFEKEDIFLLMQSINDSLKLSCETNLTASALEKNFELFYPLLESELNKTPTVTHSKVKRTDKDILEELLSTVRGLQSTQNIPQSIKTIDGTRRLRTTDLETFLTGRLYPDANESYDIVFAKAQNFINKYLSNYIYVQADLEKVVRRLCLLSSQKQS